LTDIFAQFAQSSVALIGITTPFSYERFIFNNEKINRLFNKIDVFEVKEAEAEKILLEAVFNFEDYHRVYIPYETVKEVIEKSQFYLTYIPFPEKAVDLLDTTCVYVKQNGKDKSRPIPTITPEDVNIVLTEKIHIPTTITKQMKKKLLNLETLLFSRIIQQDEAIKKLSSALRRSFLLIGKRKKPLATFLFLGPTGVGKTETAKAISGVFFSNSPNLPDSPNPSKYLIRFDMSEYQSKSDILRLIGDVSTGYPGLMTQAIREQPFGVLLLDEIEKADKDLLNIFLTILDEGYFTYGAGKRVDCKNLVIIATSNAGSDLLINPIIPINLIDEIIKRGIFSPEFPPEPRDKFPSEKN